MDTKKITRIVFTVLTILLGILLIVRGFKEAAVDTSVPQDENAFDHMLLTIPGIVILLDSAVYFFRDRLFRSPAKFIFGNAGMVFLTGVILEIVYFQFIYYGLSRPQYKLTIPAVLIILVYTAATMIISAIFEITRRATSA